MRYQWRRRAAEEGDGQHLASFSNDPLKLTLPSDCDSSILAIGLPAGGPEYQSFARCRCRCQCPAEIIKASITAFCGGPWSRACSGRLQTNTSVQQPRRRPFAFKKLLSTSYLLRSSHILGRLNLALRAQTPRPWLAGRERPPKPENSHAACPIWDGKLSDLGDDCDCRYSADRCMQRLQSRTELAWSSWCYP